jgi:predicted ATPase
VEELTKMVLESGLLQEREDRYELSGPLPPLAIPTTLHDSLMARLDRLATVREIAQLGATLGREFAYELLQAIWPLDEETLQRGLRRLVDAELIYQRGMPPQTRYLFKHALIQACADSGGGLSVAAEEYTAALPSTDCTGVGDPVSRYRQDPPRTAGASLHGSRSQR